MNCDDVLCYDKHNFNIVNDLKDILNKTPHFGQPFDYVIDTVTSVEHRDVSMNYMNDIHNSDSIVKGDNHQYITIGGSTLTWVIAGFRKLTGVNLHSKW